MLDGTSGLWCVNAGHCRPKIVEAIRKQVGELDFAGTFQMGHPRAFELRLQARQHRPAGLRPRVLHQLGLGVGRYRAEDRARLSPGEGQRAKVRLIGRERGYHGVNFGGISVGGIVNNRKMFGTLLAGVDHIRHTHDLARNAFTRGQPEHGAELADDLERLVALHDASTIAAVIVEPVAGSTGVLIPPKGYLQALRAICDKHGILLIFDEVITGFGRLGTPFGADYFGVTPDIITTAKGITNGAVPMGAVFVKRKIHDAFMSGPEEVIEFFHGYTYSGHPLACAACDRDARDLSGRGAADARGRARALLAGRGAFAEGPAARHRHPQYRPDRRHRARPDPGAPGKRAHARFVEAFERGLLVRATGDIIALSPPLIIEKSEIDQLFDILSACSRRRTETRGSSLTWTPSRTPSTAAKSRRRRRASLPSTTRRPGSRRPRCRCRRQRSVKSAVAAAKKAAAGWGDTPPLKRVQPMFRFKELLRASRREHRAHDLEASTARRTPTRRASSPAASKWSNSPAASRIC